jgi:ANTAR domain
LVSTTKELLVGINLYSTICHEIDPEAESIAELFALHAASALGSASKIDQLNQDMHTRKLIGQAIGILMQRYDIPEDNAFRFQGARLADLGRHVARETDGTGRSRRSRRHKRRSHAGTPQNRHAPHALEVATVRRRTTRGSVRHGHGVVQALRAEVVAGAAARGRTGFQPGMSRGS